MVTAPHPLTSAMAFAQQLVDLRKQRHFTQDALAERVGVHVSQIRRYEAGTSTPTLDALRNIAIALSVSADQLVFEPHERQPHNDLALLIDAITHLDDHHQKLARELLEAITLRAAANRLQPTGS